MHVIVSLSLCLLGLLCSICFDFGFGVAELINCAFGRSS